jgi:hypothetical protein
MGMEFENLFRNFKVYEMKFAILIAPHKFEAKETDEDLQMELRELHGDTFQKNI